MSKRSHSRAPRKRVAELLGQHKVPGTNRQHKDRLFKALFGSPERKDLTLALYNAMNGSSYSNPEDIELTTIDDVVYMGMKNDVSFLFDQVMNLWEQQSTPNPNIPFRFLLYYAHIMERYVSMLEPEEGGIYSSALVRIPIPRMVLFYNGPGTMPEYLKLSESYRDGTNPDLELRVRVMNINSGQDRILDQCVPLQDYTTFVELFRTYRTEDGVSSSAAASRAIARMNSGRVKDYLRAHESEVLDMLLTEYDEEKTLKAEYYVGKRAGLKEGLEQGLRLLMESAAKGTISTAVAAEMAAAYGVVDEAELRARAVAQGIQLPE